MRTGALEPTLATAAGIILSQCVYASWWVGFIPMAMALALYVLILLRSRDPISTFRLGRVHGIWVWLIFIGIGMMTESLHRPYTMEKAWGDRPRYVYAEVKAIQSKTYGDRLEAEIDGLNGARCIVRTGATTFAKGDEILIPAASLNEIAKDTSEFALRYAPMMKAKGILYDGFVKPDNLRAIGHRESLSVWSDGIRNGIEAAIEKSHLQRSTSAFLNAVLMGDKSGLDDNIRMTFANGGTAHMLALSGLHMGILAGMVIFLMWPLSAIGRYKWGYAVSIALLWLYVLMTGMSPSSVRACIMITFAFAGVIMERKNSAGHSLCAACLIMMVLDPMVLFDAGFQLSVTCVAALVVFAKRLNPIGHRRHPGLYRITEALITTMTATAASWALTSYYFGQIPLMFLPTNLLLLPMLPFYIAAGVIFTLLLCCGWEFGALGWVLDKGYDFLTWVTATLSMEGTGVLEWQIPMWGVIVWTAVFGLAGWWIASKKNNLN